MKITCTKEQLNTAVQTVQKALATKPQLTILTGIYLSAANHTLELQATDYEIGISCTIEAEVEEPGMIVLSGKYFQEVVRRLPGDTIEITTSKEDKTIKITANAAQFNLLSMPAEEFPVLQKQKSDKIVTVKDNVLKELIKKTVFACANDESRPIFTGGLLEVNQENIVMVATNTHRLALKKEVFENTSTAVKMIVPAKIMNELARIMDSDVPVDVEIHWLRNQVAFAFDNVYIISRLIEGQFPDYNKVIPAGFVTTVKLQTRDFLNAVERVSLLSRDGDYNIVRLAFKEDAVIITSNNPEVGKACETVVAQTEGNELEIAFNAKYITDILKNINDEQMIFSLNTPLSPARIQSSADENYIYIITPVRTN